MKWLYWKVYGFFRHNRPGYCEYPWCGMWTWTRLQPINRSTAVVRMCFECADEEEAECVAAWQEYYSGCY